MDKEALEKWFENEEKMTNKAIAEEEKDNKDLDYAKRYLAFLKYIKKRIDSYHGAG